MSSPRHPIAPWAPRRGAGKDMQHPETAAVRLMEGGNNVDEASRLALVDRAANLAHNRCRRVPGKMVAVGG